MKLLTCKKVEGCLEGTNVYDVFFDECIEEKFVTKLSPLGKIIINNSIDKPFFKIIVRGKYTVKGSIGNKSLRLLFPEKMDEKDLDGFMLFIQEV